MAVVRLLVDPRLVEESLRRRRRPRRLDDGKRAVARDAYKPRIAARFRRGVRRISQCSAIRQIELSPTGGSVRRMRQTAVDVVLSTDDVVLERAVA